MGRVDLAVRREGNFERLFAVKRLKDEFANETDVREMFLDEARIAGLVRHPNVVSVTDVGEDAKGPFLVMQYVEGITAGELISKREAQPLPMEVVLKIMIHAAEGLHAAHELCAADGTALQLVHRDVSPQNIMVGFDGVSLVTDFGIAKAMGRTSKTSTGVLKGKLGYLAPEQLRFEEPDRRADLFALGVVLFELLTARRLYKSREGTDGPRRILTEPPPDLADFRDDVGPELVELSFELLAKRREDRPADAKIVSRRLEAILANVVATGESVDVAAFLERHFAQQRSDMRQRIASLRENIPATVAKQSLTPLTVPTNPAASVRSPRRVALLALVVAAVGAAAVVYQGRSAPTEKPAAALSLPVASREGSASSAALVAAGLPPTAPPSASGPAPSPGPPATKSSAALRSKPGATPRPTPKPGVPIWEDY